LSANEQRNFPAQPFLKVVFMQQVFTQRLSFAKWSKHDKAADRDFSGAHFNQNFLYPTKEKKVLPQRFIQGSK
jgi:hypothetical protein